MTAEWTPLHGGGAEGTPGSPFPADRGQLEISRNELQTTGELILEAANMLRNLTGGDSWTSKAADAYKDTAGKLQKKLDETHPRFTESAAALTSFLAEVDDSLLASARAKVDEAQEAESTIASNPEQTASGGDPLTPEQEASNTARENAQADLDRLQREFDGLVEDAERAAQVAADAIQQAIDDDVKDGLYDFLRPFLEVLKIVLLVVGIIVAIAAFIFGGWVLAVIGLVIALAVFVITLWQYQNHDATLTEVILAGVGVALAGLGAFSALKIASVKGTIGGSSNVVDDFVLNLLRPTTGRHAILTPFQNFRLNFVNSMTPASTSMIDDVATFVVNSPTTRMGNIFLERIARPQTLLDNLRAGSMTNASALDDLANLSYISRSTRLADVNEILGNLAQTSSSANAAANATRISFIANPVVGGYQVLDGIEWTDTSRLIGILRGIKGLFT